MCEPSGFGGRAGCEVSTSQFFHQGVLAAITLLGGQAGDWQEGTTARGRCEPRLLLCSVVNTTILGVESGTKVLEQKPRGVLSELSLLLPTVCSTSLQHWVLAPKVEQCWGQRSLRGQLVWAQDCAGVALAWQRLVVRRWCFHFGGPGLNPCWGTEIPQAEQPKQNKTKNAEKPIIVFFNGV